MSKSMNAVMIIPTGIGCKIGGHAGDATPAARLLASVCDKLIIHPNVVNASDINEMTDNMLYVEGSMLDRFLYGKIGLKEVNSNRILVAVNKPVRAETVNAVSASRATLGIDAKIIELDTELRLLGWVGDEGATGNCFGVDELIRQVADYDFDALAISSLIEVDRKVAKRYREEGGVNPWGGVEAIVSRKISWKLSKPVAHAPIQPAEEREEYSRGEFDFICDPRIAPEIISQCFLHCVLKGLHKAPLIGDGLWVRDIDVMVSPDCWGPPHEACWKNSIPIIIVAENRTIYTDTCPADKKFIHVKNYLEAAGLIAAMKAGIDPLSIQRPMKDTEIL